MTSGRLYRTQVHPPAVAVAEAVARALAEDLTPLGDLTASLLPPQALAVGTFVARQEGVLAGRLCAAEAFARVDPEVRLEWDLDDGQDVGAGQGFGRARGRSSSILTAERTALNFLCHLSGVASLTRRYCAAAQGRAAIRDTRKTTPGLRALEKAAVRAGGGVNHRGNLSDGILVKDNHLAGMSIVDAVGKAKQLWPGRSVEVECDHLDQVEEAIAAGADLVLCDNMSPEQVRASVELVAGRALVEVSGRVTLSTVAAYADTGADLISVGALTHSAPVLDIGLDFEPTAVSGPSGSSSACDARSGAASNHAPGDQGHRNTSPQGA